MRLWGGRTDQQPDALFDALNRSFGFDQRLYAADIAGSIAYARAIEAAGLISPTEREQIIAGLNAVLAEFETGRFEALPSDEDIHTAVERRLTEMIGSAAGKLHTGRSRNDQVATDLRLWCMAALPAISGQIAALQSALLQQAEGQGGTILPGYTHLQPAQPVSYAHWLLSHFWPLQRDRERLADALRRVRVLPLGSGALAGHPFGIDREALARELGFDAASPNSLDAVADRDFVAESLFVFALTGVHLSRLAEDLILYSNPALGFIRLADAYTSGSSLMPQKRNPDALELARGKSGRLTGALLAVLTMLKGLPTSYNKDLQEDKEPLFDATDTLAALLPVLAALIAAMEPQPAKMAAALDPAMLATDLADYLVRKGLPFREAHGLAGQAVRLAESRGVTLLDLSAGDLTAISPHFGPDTPGALSFTDALARRNASGGTAPSAVEAQIEAARRALG